MNLLLATFLAVAAVEGPSPCALRKLDEPAATTMPGCGFAACVTVRAGERVCSCATEPQAERMDIGLVRGDGWVTRTSRDVPMLAGADFFEVYTGDLDGDGVPEVITAIRDGFSNGHVVNYWSMLIWNGARPDSDPLMFSVEDFGAGTFAAIPREEGCRLLATEWGGGEDARRGSGKYLYGRWFRFVDGGLVPVDSRRVLARRLLSSFQRELGDPRPLAWLRRDKIEIRPDPFDAPSRSGVLEAVQPLERGSVQVRIRFEDGDVHSYCFGAGCPVALDLQPNVIRRVGDARERVVFPNGYWPQDAADWPFSRKVRLSGPHDRFEPQVLWVGPRE